jgi:hypothetical protein
MDGGVVPVHRDTDNPPFALAELPLETLAGMLSPNPHMVVDDVRVTAMRYAWGSPATAGLWRVDVTGHEPDRAVSARYFVKLLRHLSQWPLLHTLPEPSRSVFAQRRNWRIELDMFEAGIGGVLPPGMRTPLLHHVRREGEHYLGLWWEFIDVDPAPWSLDDFTRTAYLLGRMAARRAEGQPVNDSLPEICHLPWPAPGLRVFVDLRVLAVDVPTLRDPVNWQAAPVATALNEVGDPDLPDDLGRLADRVPSLLDRLDRLPQTYAHGDASPQNLLIPDHDRATRIVIDWGLEKLLPIGFDLGQLLIGLAHADELPAAALPTIEEAIVPAYHEGLNDEGCRIDQSLVREGFVGSLICRSALSAIPFPTPAPQQPVSQTTMVNRMRLSRYLVDLAATLR